MKTKNPLNIDLYKYTEKVKALTVVDIKKLDKILAELANYAYDTYEYILELPDNIKERTKYKAESLAIDLTELKKQVTPLMNIICNIDYNIKHIE